jgi:hypothetical protein
MPTICRYCCISWLEITKNSEVWAWSYTLKRRLFIWDPLLSWSLILLGHAFAHRCQLKNGSYPQLQLWNQGLMQSVSEGWHCLTHRINTTEAKLEYWPHLNPTHTEQDNSWTQYIAANKGTSANHTHHLVDNISRCLTPSAYAQGLVHTRHRWQHWRMVEISKNLFSYTISKLVFCIKNIFIYLI